VKPEFDEYSASYEELLKDPLRDRFTGGASEFFHVRKRDLIRSYFRRRRVATGGWTYLDLGCGKGELASLLSGEFEKTCGCDPSPGMLSHARGVETRVQADPGVIPYPDASFDFVTAVCVYHHVPVEERAGLTAEVKRVLKPGGTFAMIEHNPFNPVTKAIVKRTPVDADAILLRAAEAEGLMKAQGIGVRGVEYFLFLPEKVYRVLGALEGLVGWLPLGGQYGVFGRR
jgi:SAM-dependent methyltransferase